MKEAEQSRPPYSSPDTQSTGNRCALALQAGHGERTANQLDDAFPRLDQLLERLIGDGRLPQDLARFVPHLTDPRVYAPMLEPLRLFSSFQRHGFLDMQALAPALERYSRSDSRRAMSSPARRLLSHYRANIEERGADAIAHLLLSSRSFNWLRRSERIETISHLDRALETGDLWRYWPTLSGVEAGLKRDIWREITSI